MFKLKDEVIDEDYGQGSVVGIDKKYQWGLESRCIGCIKVKFVDQDEDESPVKFTLDGREFPEGSGYFIKEKFYPYYSEIKLELDRIF